MMKDSSILMKDDLKDHALEYNQTNQNTQQILLKLVGETLPATIGVWRDLIKDVQGNEITNINGTRTNQLECPETYRYVLDLALKILNNESNIQFIINQEIEIYAMNCGQKSAPGRIRDLGQ